MPKYIDYRSNTWSDVCYIFIDSTYYSRQIIKTYKRKFSLATKAKSAHPTSHFAFFIYEFIFISRRRLISHWLHWLISISHIFCIYVYCTHNSTRCWHKRAIQCQNGCFRTTPYQRAHIYSWTTYTYLWSSFRFVDVDGFINAHFMFACNCNNLSTTTRNSSKCCSFTFEKLETVV